MIQNTVRGSILRSAKFTAPRSLLSISRSLTTENTSSKPTPPPKNDETTHFGFKTVNKDDKEKLVGGVFSSLESNYDVMNDVM